MRRRTCWAWLGDARPRPRVAPTTLMTGTQKARALAVSAQPAHLAAMMGGTLALLHDAGFEVHWLALADGAASAPGKTRAEAVRRRRAEAEAACKVIGAVRHEGLASDTEVAYARRFLPPLCALVRQINPAIVLLPDPHDLTEDAVGVARLMDTATFVKGAGNVRTLPRRRPVGGDVTLYHALPAGSRDPLRRRVLAEVYVDVAPAMDRKRRMLACFSGPDVCAGCMEETSREVGRASRRFAFAEGWRRHSHLGFSVQPADPLAQVLGDRAAVEPQYERALNTP